jgi:hypothetical protein
MKVIVQTEKEVDIRYLRIEAKVRHWGDSEVNGEYDTEDGDNIPFKEGKLWKPLIDIDSGVVVDWPKGTTAKVHYKVCDQGEYFLLDADHNVVLSLEGGHYVPNKLIPNHDEFGDYIIMNIDGDYIIMDIDEGGKILNWYECPSLEEFSRD